VSLYISVHCRVLIVLHRDLTPQA